MRNQEPLNCNTATLHEMFDTAIKTLWIGPVSPQDVFSPFNVSNLDSAKHKHSLGTLPSIDERTRIKRQVRNLNNIVAFLHEKLNERAQAVRFEWEETLAFNANQQIEVSPDSVDLDFSNLSIDSIDDDQFSSKRSSNAARDAYRYLTATPTYCNIPEKHEPQTAELGVSYSTHSRPSSSRNSSRLSTSTSMSHSRSHTPNYLASTVSSRASAKVPVSEADSTARPSSAAGHRSLRPRASLPSLRRPSSASHNYSNMSQYARARTPVMRPPSQLFVLQEGVYTPSAAQTRTPHTESIRRMSSVSALRDNRRRSTAVYTKPSCVDDALDSENQTPSRQWVYSANSGIPQMPESLSARKRLSGLFTQHVYSSQNVEPSPLLGSPQNKRAVNTRVVSDPIRPGIADTF